MIKLLGNVPYEVTIACSGGVDSMVALDFLRKKRKVSVAFFDHGTETSKNAFNFLQDYCNTNGIEFLSAGVAYSKPNNESYEEYWRNARYHFFDSMNNTLIVTAHHLDDCVETWIWSSLHGNPKLPLYKKKNVIRPFLLNKKEEFIRWAEKNNIPYIHDTSNDDTKYTRNMIRKEMMPYVLRVNPGIDKVVKKKLIKMYGDMQYVP